MNSGYSNTLSRLKSAVGTAVDKVRGVNGKEVDPDLMIYERLGEAELKKIEQYYGQDGLLSYVKTMEAKRMKKNGNSTS